MATTKVEFPVPKELKKSAIGVKRIAIEGDTFVIKHVTPADEEKDDDNDHIKFQITGNLDDDMATLRKWAANNFYFIENPQIAIDQLENYVRGLYVDGAAKTIQKIKLSTEQQTRKLQAQEQQEEQGDIKQRFIQKYYSAVESKLYESVLIGGQPCFVSLEVDVKTGEPFVRVYEKIVLPEYSDKPTMELLPRGAEMYISKPFEFQNEEELNECIKQASSETLDSLFTKVESFVRKYIVGSDTHITMLVADTILTFFQDRLGQVHYLFFYGDNDTGKSANLTFMGLIAYRAMFDIDITPANIYTYLGSTQEGQGCILEDEADNIDKNEEKMKIYKRGYNAGGTVTRQDDERIQDAYYVYCFKAFTAERRPDADKAKGFNERNLYIECQSGTPEYDIVEVTSGAAGEPVFQTRLAELQELHKLLFAYRLLHHGDPLPDIKNLAVRNREKQLTKPLLRLFQGCACRQQIASALAELIAKRRGVKKDTLDAKIYAVIKKMIENSNQTGQQIYKFANTLVFANVCEVLGGKYKNEGDQTFDTPEHGHVSHKRITQICLDKFGTTKEHSGNIRYLVFDKDKLALASEAYELDETLELLLNQGEESSRILSDTLDTLDTCIESEGVSTHDPNPENRTQESNNSSNNSENMKEIDKTEGLEGSDHNENVPARPQDVSKVSEVSAMVLEDTSIDTVIQSVLRGIDKDSFTLQDWQTRLMFLPVQHPYHCNQDEAEQTLHALIEEGKLKEIEPGRYTKAA